LLNVSITYRKRITLPTRLQREDGQSLVEYALILVLVTLVCVGGLTSLGVGVNNVLNGIAGAF
jgi:pilus assembly protein Flp/PilA